MPTAWLALAVPSGQRVHVGNDDYDDAPAHHYSWDSKVPHHADLAQGDRIVLWNRKYLLGMSVIDGIASWEDSRTTYTCPDCGTSNFKPRKTALPRFRCDNGHLFDDAAARNESVTAYRCQHEAGWTDLSGVLTGRQLRALCLHPKSQQSFRELVWDRFQAMLAAAGHHSELTVVEAAAARLLPGGHRRQTVRVRTGQADFRAELLRSYGAVCAFTGAAPADALDAAHLYSYAAVGEHHREGGFLLRRDLHRQFDLGKIAVDSRTRTLDVSSDLAGYAEYGRLHGAPLQVHATRRQTAWLKEHWTTYRG